MRPRPKSCVVCGRRTEDGSSRCEAHKTGGARLRPCLVCGRPSQGNYCADHLPEVDEAERNARHPYRRYYNDAEYRRNRQIAFERAHGKCEACGIPLKAGRWSCDHKVPVRAWHDLGMTGSPHQLSNLQCLCEEPREGAKRGCAGLKNSRDRRDYPSNRTR